MIDQGLTEERPQAPRASFPERRRNRRRQWVVLMVVLALCVATLVAVVVRRPAIMCRSPVAARAVADLQAWTGWLEANQVNGYIGEVGWPEGPDAAAWNAVGDQWFSAVDRSSLWVTVWAAGRWWPASYRMAVYRLDPTTPPKAGAQTKVVTAHQRVPGTLRGLDLPSGAFDTGGSRPGYGGARPGRYGHDYYYEDATDFRQIAASGAALVRVSVAWERLQHQPGAPLDQREVARLRASLDAAAAAGLAVVVDLHGYGDYWESTGAAGHRRLTLGSAALPDERFAGFWRELSLALQSSTAVVGYGLMNEPTRLAADPATGARRWEVASRAAVSAIRSTGDQRTVFVAGYGGASPALWSTYHERAWISDTDGPVRYEAHQYFDADRTGNYARGYAEEQVMAEAAGFAPCA